MFRINTMVLAMSACGVLAAAPAPYLVDAGTKIPLVMINSVSTRHAAEGDRLYLETSFPILSNGKIVIPPGSYVAGTITSAKRGGRVKGKAELFLRFDSLTLPNGVTRDFRARVGGIDGRSSQQLDRSEGRITAEATKGADARTVGEGAAGGASIGVIAGSVSGRPGMGAGIGAVAGAAAGLMGVLLTRGQDVVLARGTTVEMVLDRDLEFTAAELDFSQAGAARRAIEGDGTVGGDGRNGSVLPGRRGGLGPRNP
jgi:type IV secretion system protein VirB10